ncbi:MAG: SAM-dependent methyltransferase [Desulfovibrionaceae bacterium]|nr:SAM-dependent methyltransferase [Desulfovibrionaceae bacterium]
MPETPLTPGPLLALAGGYWESHALHAGVVLDVFGPLAAGPLDACALAEKTGCDVRALDMLLVALTSLKLLAKSGGAYRLSESAREFLVKDSPRYVGNMIRHHHHLAALWSRLDEAVAAGAPVRSSMPASEREDFLLGMFNVAMGIAPNLAPRMPLSGRERLLDVGGGPGTYAVQFCLAHPKLRATIFDLPGSRPIAEAIAERFGVSGRVDFAAGDYLENDLPGGYDAAWLSQILHAESPERCLTILRKAAGALTPGGALFVHEFLLDDAMDGPLFPALFSLNMLLQTRGGQSYSDGQVRSMLAEAGLTDIRRMGFRGPTDSGILWGIKA